MTNVFYLSSGNFYNSSKRGYKGPGWYFWDENKGEYCYGPYETKEIATYKADAYFKQIKEKNFSILQMDDLFGHQSVLKYALQLDSDVKESDIRCNGIRDGSIQYTCAAGPLQLDICYKSDGQHWFNIDVRGVRIRIHGKLSDWPKLRNINLDKQVDEQ